MIDQWIMPQNAEYRQRLRDNAEHPKELLVSDEMFDAIMNHLNNIRPDLEGFFVPKFMGIPVCKEVW